MDYSATPHAVKQLAKEMAAALVNVAPTLAALSPAERQKKMAGDIELGQQLPDSAALTEKQAARYIGMSISYLRCDRMNGHREGRTPGPPFVKIGRAVRYLKSDLDAWLMAHRVVQQPVEEEA